MLLPYLSLRQLFILQDESKKKGEECGKHVYNEIMIKFLTI